MPPEGSHLADTVRRLNIPPRRRLEMIEELGADLEALQAAYERRGLSPAAARREALMRLVPADESIYELNAQHAPRTARWLKAAGIGGRVERFGAAAAAILAGAAVLMIPAKEAAVQGSLLLWAQALIAALLAANWCRGAAGLWIMGVLPPDVRSLFQARQAGLITGAASLGGLGALWQGYIGLGTLEASPDLVWHVVRPALLTGAIGIGAAIFGALGWLALLPRLISDESSERRIETLLTPSRPLDNSVE
ncbi:MAG: hypothetical protein F4Y07_16010 [Gemmatimonadetes bacterium]|nr:hypothetical protein [Gemmatimonadota bacterium]